MNRLVRIVQTVGAVALCAIPLTAFLLMWEVIELQFDAMGWFVAAYLFLVLVILTGMILRDLWLWVTSR